MRSLLRFLSQYKNGVLFLVLECISLFLFFNRSSQQNLVRLTKAHNALGKAYAYIAAIKSYPLLKQACEALLQENSLLREQLSASQSTGEQPNQQLFKKRDHFIPAKVINHSIVYSKNYLTLDKGSDHGIAPGMGVISAQGVVGRVKAVSEHFALVTSLLHVNMLVSAKVGKTGIMGTIHWHGRNPFEVQLLYVPKHAAIEIGDPVYTSGYNATFQEGISIGSVKQVEVKPDALFQAITVSLSTDFSTLQHVYVAKTPINQEKENLEQLISRYEE